MSQPSWLDPLEQNVNYVKYTVEKKKEKEIYQHEALTKKHSFLRWVSQPCRWRVSTKHPPKDLLFSFKIRQEGCSFQVPAVCLHFSIVSCFLILFNCWLFVYTSIIVSCLFSSVSSLFTLFKCQLFIYSFQLSAICLHFSIVSCLFTLFNYHSLFTLFTAGCLQVSIVSCLFMLFNCFHKKHLIFNFSIDEDKCHLTGPYLHILVT